MVVGTRELARHLSLSVQGVGKLARANVLHREGRGRWDVDRNRTAYLQNLRAVAAGHMGRGGLSLPDERAKLTKIMAARARLDLRERRGELVSLSGMRGEAFRQGRQTREAILAVPSRIAADVFAAKTISEAEGIIESELRDVLVSLAEPDSNGKGG